MMIMKGSFVSFNLDLREALVFEITFSGKNTTIIHLHNNDSMVKIVRCVCEVKRVIRD